MDARPRVLSCHTAKCGRVQTNVLWEFYSKVLVREVCKLKHETAGDNDTHDSCAKHFSAFLTGHRIFRSRGENGASSREIEAIYVSSRLCAPDKKQLRGAASDGGERRVASE